MYEVEIKAKAKPDTLKRVQAIAMQTKELHQKDTYYAHPCRDFASTDEALRVRDTKGTFTLTYKGPKLDSTTKTRLEKNIPVTRDIYELIENLGFKKVFTVEKERHNYEVDNIEISYDVVKDLGEYIELETITEEEGTIGKARESLFSLFAQLGFEKEDSITKSYLELLLENSSGRKNER